MKPFSTIAIPHSDILEGRLTMDVFAADLWQVFKGEAPEEYQNPDIFFRKTFLTAGIKNLLDIVKKRLDGKGGDSVIQLQTPFGGGKTHSLIALYHKAKEWKVNVVVIDGTALDAEETTLWGEIEMQLTGKINLLSGLTSPGREKLKNILENNQPLLILMDEVLQYTTKSAGREVGSSNLASQTLAFMQELTETVSILPRAVLVLTLPSSVLEHYDENAEKLFQQLQKVVGRMEKVFTPVQDEEVAQVIRRRLFSQIDEKSASEIIEKFLDYAEKEKILPEGLEKASYREKFIKSFPFQPEVIDVLYKRWGSFPTFQRTRGVLRLLALVVHSLKDSKIPFIRLGDFDLKNEEIRRELIKHIGQEYDSVIASDITSPDSGAKKVDSFLGSAYSPYSFGTKVATAIFMYSFSGGPERGASVNELKLSCADPNEASSIIVETIDKLKENLFYLSDDGLFFTNQPNLNRILLSKMETIDDKRLEEEEERLLKASLDKSNVFDIYFWPKNTKDVPDNSKLKLVVLRQADNIKNFIENCGDKPRVYRNTLIFLCPSESERVRFEQFLKRKIAWESIKNDEKLKLTDEQKKRLDNEIEKNKKLSKEIIRNLYRLIFLPAKDNFKEVNLGIGTYGVEKSIDKEIYEKLKNEGEILEKLSPLSIKEKYLKDKDYVETKKIFESFYRTPGELRVISAEVFKNSIREGVKRGIFGLGILDNDKPTCKFFKEDCSPNLVEGEVIIKAELCQVLDSTELVEKEEIEPSGEARKRIGVPSSEKEEELKSEVPSREKFSKIKLRLAFPLGKFSDFTEVVTRLRKKFKFNQGNVKAELLLQDGEITKSDYEDKIKEEIIQRGITIEDEDLMKDS